MMMIIITSITFIIRFTVSRPLSHSSFQLPTRGKLAMWLFRPILRMQTLRPDQAVRGSGVWRRRSRSALEAWAGLGGAGRPAALRCVCPRGNPSLHLGAARKLHHVWAATSEGADPPLSLGAAKSSPFAQQKSATGSIRKISKLLTNAFCNQGM